MARHNEGAVREEVNMQHNIWAVLVNAKILAIESGLPLRKFAEKPENTALIEQYSGWYKTHGPQSIIDILALHTLTDVPNWQDYNDEARYTSWERSLHVFQRVDEIFRDLGDEDPRPVAYRIGLTAMQHTNLGIHHNLVRLAPLSMVYKGAKKEATRFNNVTEWFVRDQPLGVTIEIAYNEFPESEWYKIDDVPVLFDPRFDFNGQSYTGGILDGVPTMWKLNQLHYVLLEDAVQKAMKGEEATRADGRHSTILRMDYKKPKTSKEHLKKRAFWAVSAAFLTGAGLHLVGTDLAEPALYAASAIAGASGWFRIGSNQALERAQIENQQRMDAAREGHAALEQALDKVRESERDLAGKVKQRTAEVLNLYERTRQQAETIFRLYGEIVGLKTSYERHDIVNHLREIDSELQKITVTQFATSLYGLLTGQNNIAGAREYLTQVNETFELELSMEEETTIEDIREKIGDAMLFSDELLTEYARQHQRSVSGLGESIDTTGIEALVAPTIEKIAAYAKVKKHSESIHHNVDKIKDMLKGINTEVDLAATITESLEQLKTSYPLSYTIDVEGDRSEYALQSIKDLFVGAVVDLARNAIKHGDANNISIRLGKFSTLTLSEQERYKREMHIPANINIEYYLAITDDGIGIDPQKAMEMTAYVNDTTQQGLVNFSSREDGSGGEGTINVKRFGSLQNAYSHFERVSSEGGTRATMFFTSKTMF